MRRITTLSTLVVAALAMAAVFSASASAGTVLCEKAVTVCAPGDVKPAGTSLLTGATTSEGFVLKASNGETRLACSHYIIAPKTNMKNGNPLPATFESNVQSSNCKVNETQNTCSGVTMNNPPTEIEAGKNGGGSIRIGSAGQPLQVSMFCSYTGIPDTCVYKATGTVTMTVSDWGESAKISGAPMKQTAGSFYAGCGLSTLGYTLHVNNILDNVDPDYISSATETVLCGVGYGEYKVCPNSKVRPAGTNLITAPLLAEHHISVSQFTCKSGNISFTTTQEAGAPLPANTSGHLQPSKCVPPGHGTCSSATVNSPGATMESTGFGSGRINIGSASQPLTFTFVCNGFGVTETCSFAATGTVKMEIQGEGSVGRIAATPLSRTAGNWFYCGSSNLTLEAEVQVDNEDTINVV